MANEPQAATRLRWTERAMKEKAEATLAVPKTGYWQPEAREHAENVLTLLARIERMRDGKA